MDRCAAPLRFPRIGGKLYALALVLFVCSILSKSVTGSMPAIILVLIWWKRGSDQRISYFLPTHSVLRVSACDGHTYSLPISNETLSDAQGD